MISLINEEEFWQYSVELYQSGDNQRLFLSLQDRFDLNVNVLLSMYYLAFKNIALSPTQIAQLNESIVSENKITKAIRSQRRKLKDSEKACDQSKYDELLDKELNSEKREQKAIMKYLLSQQKENKLEVTKVVNLDDMLRSLLSINGLREAELTEAQNLVIKVK